LLVFSVWIPDFFWTAITWKTIVLSESLTAILAVGLLWPLSAGVYDLSVGQNLGFCALICASLMTKAPHLSFPVAILLTLGVGALVGAVNGFLVAVVGLDSFIATLGTSSILLAGAAIIANGQYIGPVPANFQHLTSPSPAGIPSILFYLLAFALLSWWLLEHTPLGRRIYATGANAEAARLAGIRIRHRFFWTLVVSGVMASITGILFASSLGTVTQTDGPSYLLPAFASCFLGATQIKPGRFNVWGLIVATLLLGIGVEGLQIATGQIWINDAFNGVALLVAVSAGVLLGRVRDRRGRKAAREAPLTGMTD
jgi:ribose transport system permease protein